MNNQAALCGAPIGQPMLHSTEELNVFNSTDNAAVAGFDRALMPERLSLRFDVSDYETVHEIPVFVETVSTSYQRVLQALRDIRHMLPECGVAIVDSVLDQAE
jgi:hypothetical protein